MADALSRISEERLSDEEAGKVLKAVPIDSLKRLLPTRLLRPKKAIFDNLTSEAGRSAEQEYNTDSAIYRKADSIEVNVRSVRLSTQMHVTDWTKAQRGDPDIKVAMDWCCLDKKKSEPWMKQLAKLKSRLGSKNTSE